MRGPVSRSSKGKKDVNDLLSTLRGEHFRRTLNTQRAPRPGAGALPASGSGGPSLPYAEIYGLRLHGLSSRAVDVEAKVVPSSVAGPIPRSWAAATAPVKVLEGPAWRAMALSLFFAQSDDGPDSAGTQGSTTTTATSSSGRGGGGGTGLTQTTVVVPCLAELCLRVLLAHYGAGADVLAELAPHLAPHHRRRLMGICAVQSPLSSASLRVLLLQTTDGDARHMRYDQVDGELIIVEPATPPRPELFLIDDDHHSAGLGQTGRDAEGRRWDAEGDGPGGSQPLTALAIVSTALPIPTLLALPPSLTRLALVHLSAPVPLHRLPDKCPLLEFLDISYNPWLGELVWGGERALERVAWGRWEYLKVLGCRDCGVTSEELRKVNEGRWDDVTIVT